MKSALEFFCRVANINRALLVIVILGIVHLEYVYWTSSKQKDIPSDCIVMDHSHLEHKLLCHERQIDKLTNQYDSIMNCQYQMNKDLRRNRNLLALVGSLHNENWCAVRNGSRDYLYINHDWTIDRLPKYLTLSNSEREWFNNYLNKKVRYGGDKDIIQALLPYDPLDEPIRQD